MLKKKSGILLLFMTIIFSYGCWNSGAKDKSEIAISCSWDTLLINTQKNLLGLSDRPVIFNENGEEFYANYNNDINSLIVYNLDKGNFDSKVTFFSTGPNKIDGLTQYVVWGNKILRQSLYNINIVNFSGELEETLELKDINPKLDETHSFTDGPGIKIANFKSLSLNSTSQSVVFNLFNKEDRYKDLFKDPTFLEFNLNTRELTPHKVVFPDDINKRFYGPLVYPNIITKGDSIIYNFPYKAAVYIYNKKTGETIVKPFIVDNILPTVEGLDLSQKGNNSLLIHFFNGEAYYRINYDTNRNLYYILYSQAKVDDEPVLRHLIVFNKSIEKLGEIDIPTDFSPNFAISKKGLLFRNVKDDSFDTLTLHVLNVEVEKK